MKTLQNFLHIMDFIGNQTFFFLSELILQFMGMNKETRHIIKPLHNVNLFIFSSYCRYFSDGSFVSDDMRLSSLGIYYSFVWLLSS